MVYAAIRVEPKLSSSWLRSHSSSTEPAYLELSEVTLYSGLQMAALHRQADQQTSALWPKLNMSAKSGSGRNFGFFHPPSDIRSQRCDPRPGAA
jgi:hypothetical protein